MAASLSSAPSAQKANPYVSNAYRRDVIGWLESVATSKHLKKSLSQENLNGIAKARESIEEELIAACENGTPELIAHWEKASEQAEQLQKSLEELNGMLSREGIFDEQAYEAEAKLFIDTFGELTANLKEIQELSASTREACQQIQQDLWPETLALLIIGLLLFTKSIPSYAKCLEAILEDAKKARQDLTQPFSKQNDTLRLVDQTLSALGKNFEDWIRVARIERKYKKIGPALQLLRSSFKARRKAYSNARRHAHPQARHDAQFLLVQLNEQTKNLLLALSASRVNESQGQHNHGVLEQIQTSLALLEGRLSRIEDGESITLQQTQGIQNDLASVRHLITNETSVLHAADQKLSDQMTQFERGLQSLIGSAAALSKKIAQKKVWKPIEQVAQQDNGVAAEESEASELTQAISAQQFKAEELGAELEKKIHTQVERLKLDINELEQKQAHLAQSISAIHTKLKTHEGDKEEAKKRLALIKERTDLLQGEKQRLSSKPDGGGAALARLEQHLQFFIDEKSKVLRRLGETEQLIELFEQELNTLHEVQAKTNKEVDALRKQVEAQGTQLEELKAQQKAEADAWREETEAVKAALEVKLNAANDRISTAEQELEALRQVKTKASAEAEGLRQQLTAQATTLTELAAQQKTDAEALRSEFEVSKAELEEKLEVANGRVSSAEQGLEALQGAKTEASAEAEGLRQQLTAQATTLTELAAQQKTAAEALRNELEASRIELEEKLEMANGRISSAEQELKALQRVKTEASAEAEDLRQLLSDQAVKLTELTTQQKADAEVLRNELEASTVELEEKLEVANGRVSSAEQELKALQQVKLEASAEAEGLRQQLTAQATTLTELAARQETDAEALRNEFEVSTAELEEKLEVANGRVSSAEQELKALQQVKLEASAEVEGLRQQLTAQATTLTELAARQETDAEALRNEFEVSAAELKEKLVTADGRVSSVEQELKALQQAKTEASAEAEDLRQLLSDQATKLTELTTQQKADAEALRNEFEVSAAELKEKLVTADGRVSSVEQELKALQQAKTEASAEAEDLRQLLSDQATKLTELTTQQKADAEALRNEFEVSAAELKEKLVTADGRVSSVEQELKALQQAKTEASAEAEDLRQLLSDQATKLTELATQQKADAEALRNELEVSAVELKEKLEVANGRISSVEQGLEALQGAKTEASAEAEDLRQQLADQATKLTALSSQQVSDTEVLRKQTEAVKNVLEAEQAKQEAALNLAEQKVQQEIIAITKQLAALEKDRDAGVEQIGGHNTAITQLKNALQIIVQHGQAELEGIHDLLFQLLLTTNNLLQRDEDREQAIATGKVETQQEINSLRDEVKTLREALEELLVQQKSDQPLQEEIERTHNELMILQGQRAELVQKLDEAEKKRISAERELQEEQEKVRTKAAKKIKRLSTGIEQLNLSHLGEREQADNQPTPQEAAHSAAQRMRLEKAIIEKMQELSLAEQGILSTKERMQEEWEKLSSEAKQKIERLDRAITEGKDTLRDLNGQQKPGSQVAQEEVAALNATLVRLQEREIGLEQELANIKQTVGEQADKQKEIGSLKEQIEQLQENYGQLKTHLNENERAFPEGEELPAQPLRIETNTRYPVSRGSTWIDSGFGDLSTPHASTPERSSLIFSPPTAGHAGKGSGSSDMGSPVMMYSHSPQRDHGKLGAFAGGLPSIFEGDQDEDGRSSFSSTSNSITSSLPGLEPTDQQIYSRGQQTFTETAAVALVSEEDSRVAGMPGQEPKELGVGHSQQTVGMQTQGEWEVRSSEESFAQELLDVFSEVAKEQGQIAEGLRKGQRKLKKRKIEGEKEERHIALEEYLKFVTEAVLSMREEIRSTQIKIQDFRSENLGKRIDELGQEVNSIKVDTLEKELRKKAKKLKGAITDAAKMVGVHSEKFRLQAEMTVNLCAEEAGLSFSASSTNSDSISERAFTDILPVLQEKFRSELNETKAAVDETKAALEEQIREVSQRLDRSERGRAERRQRALSVGGSRIRSRSLANELRRAENLSTASESDENSLRPFEFGATEAEQLMDAVAQARETQGQLSVLTAETEARFQAEQEILASIRNELLGAIDDLRMGQGKLKDELMVFFKNAQAEKSAELNGLLDDNIVLFEELNQTVTGLERELSTWKQSCGRLKTELEQRTEKAIKDSREETQKANKASEMRIKELIHNLSRQITSLESEQQKLGHEAARHAELTEHKDALRREVNEHKDALRKEVKNMQDQGSQTWGIVNEALGRVNARMQSVGKLTQDIQTLKKEVQSLGDFKNSALPFVRLLEEFKPGYAASNEESINLTTRMV